MTLRSVLARIAALATVSMVMFAVGELFVQHFPAVKSFAISQPSMYVDDADRGWRLRENLDVFWPVPWFPNGGIRVITDGDGRRVAEPGARADGPRTILFIGDSFTFGWGVEVADTFAQRVVDGLRQALGNDGDGLVAVNAGVPGYGPENELATLERALKATVPEVVVIAYVENDVINAMDGKNYVVVKDGDLVGRAALTRTPTVTDQVKTGILRASALARVTYRLTQGRREEGSRSLDRRLLAMLDEVVPSEIADGFSKTERVIRQMVDAAHARRIPVVLATISRSYQVFPDELEARLRSSGIEDPEGRTLVALDTFTSSLCQNVGADVCAPLDAPFRAARDEGATRTDLFIEGDGHWTARGHDVAAAAIARAVAKAIGDRQAAHGQTDTPAEGGGEN